MTFIKKNIKMVKKITFLGEKWLSNTSFLS